MSKEQGAGFYRFKIGEFEVASVSDGFLQYLDGKRQAFYTGRYTIAHRAPPNVMMQIGITWQIKEKS